MRNILILFLVMMFSQLVPPQDTTYIPVYYNLGTLEITLPDSNICADSVNYNIHYIIYDSIGVYQDTVINQVLYCEPIVIDTTIIIGEITINTAPNVPNLILPSNNSINQALNLVLIWSCVDPEGDMLFYDVYFGINPDPPVVLIGTSNTNYNVGPVNYNTTYYWKIFANDGEFTSLSSIWNFTTQLQPPPNPGNNHYIDKNANGQNNGLSWLDAWQTFSAINWSLIAPGDNIYISGGTNSTIYYEMLVPRCQGTATDRITIIAGKYSPNPSGHSGRVIIDGGGGVRDNCIFFDDYAAGSPSYITVKGFELREATGGIAFNIDDTTPPLAIGIIIDSCYIYDFYDVGGVFVLGNTEDLIIQNCIIRTCLLCGNQTDCFHFNGTDTQHARRTIIRNNVILNKNQHPTAHNDAIQSVVADGFIIYNNIIINDSVYSQQGGGLPFILGSIDYNYDKPIEQRNPVILYNNFCYMGGAWYPNANMGYTMWTRYYSDQAHQPLTYVINNTVVTNGPRVAGVGQEYKIDLFINNIDAMYCLPDGTLGEDWRSGGTHGWHTNFSSNSGWRTTMPMDSIRNNLFWKEDNIQTLFTGGYTYSTGGTGGISGWSDWVSKGGSGLNTDPLFVQTFGHEPNQSVLVPDLQASSPAIGAGEDLTALFKFFNDTWGIQLPSTDINGKFRNLTNPSIGAYEY